MTEHPAVYTVRSTKPALKRAVRLMYILDLLRHKWHSIDDLAAKCGVSERTIYRDIGDLQAEPIYAPLVIRVLYADIENSDACCQSD